MDHLLFDSHTETDTERLGRALARCLPNGSTVALHGTLGAGKTRLVRAIAVASGVVATDVLSPTFVLCHEYRGSERDLYHFDVYRVGSDDEFLELGPDEYFESPGLTLVEWGERVERCLPQVRWDIEIEVLGEHERQFRVSITDMSLAHHLLRLKQELQV